ncbi:MAG: histidine--tRNA ligase [bacterium]
MKEKIQPKLLKGFRDIRPDEMVKRTYILKKIENVFLSHSFSPLSTPTIEYLDILKGKMGDEADKLLFSFIDTGGREVGLRYDFTVSLARFIAMNPNIKLPFKRYQIGSVFRAEKPQRGRFREFTQCDFDIVGTDSPVADAEIISVMFDVMIELGIKDFQIQINDRRLLFKILRELDIQEERILSICKILDKLDRIGKEGVISLLKEEALFNESIKIFIDISEPSFNYKKTIDKLTEVGEIEKESVQFLKFMNIVSTILDNDRRILFSPLLARGLDYYTGLVFEVLCESAGIGSIAGGGRYDNMIGLFSKRRIPATGASFGLDRIEEIVSKLDIFPKDIGRPFCLITIFGDETINESITIYRELLNSGIRVELYPEPKNIGKQIGYASSMGFLFAIIIGEDEIRENKIKIKNMNSGEEKLLRKNDTINFLKYEYEKYISY